MHQYPKVTVEMSIWLNLMKLVHTPPNGYSVLGEQSWTGAICADPHTCRDRGDQGQPNGMVMTDQILSLRNRRAEIPIPFAVHVVDDLLTHLDRTFLFDYSQAATQRIPLPVPVHLTGSVDVLLELFTEQGLGHFRGN